MTAPPGPFDLLVVGGGINGAGIACDAAGRGLSVLLAEAGDLAQGTSSASSKLIHGGLRYLEFLRFRLVRESLIEREVLLAKAPHVVRPLRFVLPHRGAVRPAWMVRLGLLLYDHLGPHPRLAGARAVDLAEDRVGRPLKDALTRGFEYSDCRVDDSRLVVLTAMHAAARGAEVATRLRLVAARREGGLWRARLESGAGGVREVAARALVNATGPWVERVLAGAVALPPEARRRRVRLVKGSHIVVPRLHDRDEAFILQHRDRRVVFVIPYCDRFSLIGTTEVPFDGDPATAAIDPAEARYLCDAVNGAFRRSVTPSDAVWSFAGVRPLFDDDARDPSALTRDYVLDLDAPAGAAPLLTVYGGKITTYRRLAEAALARLAPSFPGLKPAWTASAPLPGGDVPGEDMARLGADLARDYPGLPRALIRALAARHGTLARRVLGDARATADLGLDFGGTLTEREVAYLVEHEWARTADDILWRRTKAGLFAGADGAGRLARHLAGERAET